MVPTETVTISKETYDQLVRDQLFLNCLEGAGVDNWEGFEYAVDCFNEQKSDEEDEYGY